MPITCPTCSREFSGTRLNARHTSICNPSSAPLVEPCLCGHESTSLTQMKRHRSKCDAWQSRDAEGVVRSRARATSLARYGVEHANQTEEVRARVAATNVERYGATNPFSREASTFGRVQASLDGKRPVLKGADNPFAREDVKAKVRDHWVNGHGVTNPQQVAEIRARTKATTVERYGGELRGSPVLADKIRATNQDRYGDAFPQRTDAVKDRQRETNLLRHGVPWTSMSPEVRAKQLTTHHARYGSHWFASDEGKAKIREVMQERYGVDHPSHMEGWWERVVATNMERYGVEHALQLREFMDKQRATNIERYGTPFAGLRNRGMNGLETTVHDMAPEGTGGSCRCWVGTRTPTSSWSVPTATLSTRFAGPRRWSRRSGTSGTPRCSRARCRSSTSGNSSRPTRTSASSASSYGSLRSRPTPQGCGVASRRSCPPDRLTR